MQRSGTKVYEAIDAASGRMIARMPAAGKSVWLDVEIYNSGDMYVLTIVEETAMTQDAALKLEIHGHTDSTGTKDGNLKLSKDRAESVEAYLVKRGGGAGRLTTAGFGDTQPVADNKTEDRRAQNRRVVLVKKS